MCLTLDITQLRRPKHVFHRSLALKVQVSVDQQTETGGLIQSRPQDLEDDSWK